MKCIAIFIILSLMFTSPVFADWPMPGHDPARTSNSQDEGSFEVNNPVWAQPIPYYIPSKAPLITIDRSSTGGQSMVYVPTARGVYALNPLNGSTIWSYQTDMPVGHSPTIDKQTETMFIPVLDKTIHKIDAITKEKLAQTGEAGAGFYTSPLVVKGTVYAGNRDGYFYAFDASDLSYKWAFKTDGPVNYSAAFYEGNAGTSSDDLILFASDDSYAYAVHPDGTEAWRSGPYPGNGFNAFWPVVYNNIVIFSRSANHPAYTDKFNQLVAKGIINGGSLLFNTGEIEFDTTNDTITDTSRFVQWLEADPDRQVQYALNISDGSTAYTPPIFFWGNSSDNQYPPAVGADGRLWFMSLWRNDGAWFGQGRYAGWIPGTNTLLLRPHATGGVESGDEPEPFAISGNILYSAPGGDHTDKTSRTDLVSGRFRGWTWFDYPDGYWGRWNEYKYGINVSIDRSTVWGSSTGTHGYQNPPVPLGNRVFIHRSNAVISFSP